MRAATTPSSAIILLSSAATSVVAWPYAKSFPPLPWPTSWALNTSTTGYFIGNDKALNSPSELDAEAKWGIIGIGWQLNAKASNWSHNEIWERQTAFELKKRNPRVKVLLPRNTEVGARFLDSVAAVWDQEAFWLKCTDPKNTSKPPATCIGKWSSKNKPTGVALSADKKWFDWSNTALQDWYLHTYLNSSIHDNLYDGAYFDCSCGKPPGAILPPGFEDGHAKTWAAANKLLADNRKWGSAWAGGNILNPTASQKQCRFLFGHLIDNGALPNQTVQFQYSGGNFTLAVAGVLLARGRDATFVNRVQGAYDASITDHAEDRL